MLTGIITYGLQLYFVLTISINHALGFLGGKRRRNGVTTRMGGKNK
jgi:hypothetical protein